MLLRWLSNINLQQKHLKYRKFISLRCNLLIFLNSLDHRRKAFTRASKIHRQGLASSCRFRSHRESPIGRMLRVSTSKEVRRISATAIYRRFITIDEKSWT